jgi:hypothetical protein
MQAMYVNCEWGEKTAMGDNLKSERLRIVRASGINIARMIPASSINMGPLAPASDNLENY